MINILLVEDNRADVVLLREALGLSQWQCRIDHVLDGEQAMQFLRRQGRFTQALRPDLIVLDLNLPGMSGREVLREVHSDPSLAEIQVVILTTSAADRDVVAAFGLEDRAYIVKPHTFDEYCGVVTQIRDFCGAVK